MHTYTIYISSCPVLLRGGLTQRWQPNVPKRLGRRRILYIERDAYIHYIYIELTRTVARRFDSTLVAKCTGAARWANSYILRERDAYTHYIYIELSRTVARRFDSTLAAKCTGAAR